jgi:hypothetical protein
MFNSWHGQKLSTGPKIALHFRISDPVLQTVRAKSVSVKLSEISAQTTFEVKKL